MNSRRFIEYPHTEAQKLAQVCALQQKLAADVRFGSKGDMGSRPSNVRSYPNIRHRSASCVEATGVAADTIDQNSHVSEVTVVVGRDMSVVFRRYQPSDYDQVAALWSRINRELAPAGMEELFEQYIAMTISDELVRLSEIFSEAKKNAFWVVDLQGEIVGCFGIESHSELSTELRRMYLDREFRGAGIAKRMLEWAEEQARSLGFRKMLLSTAEIQRAADRFYRRSGFRQVRMEVAQTMSTKQAGGGLTRCYFEKEL